MEAYPQTVSDLFYAFGAFFVIFLSYLILLRRDQKRLWNELEQLKEK